LVVLIKLKERPVVWKGAVVFVEAAGLDFGQVGSGGCARLLVAGNGRSNAVALIARRCKRREGRRGQGGHVVHWRNKVTDWLAKCKNFYG
jgi:hypothetical protein